MYHPVDIQKLSQKQVSRLLNSHPVRVKVGHGLKIHVSKEQLKKLHKSHLKGCGMNLTLDPYAIAHNQYLRQAVGMVGKGQVSEGLKQTTAQAATDLINASTARAIQGIEGNGMKGKGGLKTFKKTMAAVGDVLGLNSGVTQGVKQQLVRALGQAGTAMIQEQVPGSAYQPQALTKGEIRRMNRQMAGTPDMFSPSFEPMPKPTLSRSLPMTVAEPVEATVVQPLDLPYDLPSVPSAPGKLYASGLKKKRVMSQAQKDALAKGRHALRLKLESMGAGAKKHRRGGALFPAGVTSA